MTTAAQPPLSLYYWPTPNGHKVTLFLGGLGLGRGQVDVGLPRNGT